MKLLLLGEGRGRKPKQLQKSFSTESSLNHMVPNSPIHPDAAMGGNSRDVSPTKGNRTPGRKLSPPKHLEAPVFYRLFIFRRYLPSRILISNVLIMDNCIKNGQNN